MHYKLRYPCECIHLIRKCIDTTIWLAVLQNMKNNKKVSGLPDVLPAIVCVCFKAINPENYRKKRRNLK